MVAHWSPIVVTGELRLSLYLCRDSQKHVEEWFGALRRCLRRRELHDGRNARQRLNQFAETIAANFKIAELVE